MKVVHLTSVHAPSDVRIFHKECKTLADAGYRVALVTAHEHADAADGVQVKCLPQAPGRAARITWTSGRILRQALREDADVYHFHDPELIPVGLCLKLLRRRVIYDVHEDVPRQILSKEWIYPRLRSAIAAAMAGLERLSERWFDGIVVANPAVAPRFRADKTVVVPNYPILEEFDLAEGTQPYCERAPLVAYVGGMTRVRGIQEMVQAVDMLPETLGATLHLAGTFAEAGLEAHCRALPEWRRVVYIGWQSRAEVAALLRRARVGLVVLHPLPNYKEAYAIKMFEYMAAALPVVASDFPLWREIVDGADCGLLVNPMDPQAIATALEWLLTHPDEAAAMGERGRQAVVTTYNWTAAANELLAFYERLLA
jgi:hypothetical protein